MNNDTECLSRALRAATSAGKSILEVMQQIRGPFGMIYYEAASRRLWFGRDCLGRRSLLWQTPPRTDGLIQLMIASTGLSDPESSDIDVLDGQEQEEASTSGFVNAMVQEVPAVGLYCIELNKSFTLMHQSSVTSRVSGTNRCSRMHS
jgi:asparagine synthetase B (glutamine-hydrolysing)